jgi:hypothetical protein
MSVETKKEAEIKKTIFDNLIVDSIPETETKTKKDALQQAETKKDALQQAETKKDALQQGETKKNIFDNVIIEYIDGNMDRIEVMFERPEACYIDKDSYEDIIQKIFALVIKDFDKKYGYREYEVTYFEIEKENENTVKFTFEKKKEQSGSEFIIEEHKMEWEKTDVGVRIRYDYPEFRIRTSPINAIIKNGINSVKYHFKDKKYELTVFSIMKDEDEIGLTKFKVGVEMQFEVPFSKDEIQKLKTIPFETDDIKMQDISSSTDKKIKLESELKFEEFNGTIKTEFKFPMKNDEINENMISQIFDLTMKKFEINRSHDYKMYEITDFQVKKKKEKYSVSISFNKYYLHLELEDSPAIIEREKKDMRCKKILFKTVEIKQEHPEFEINGSTVWILIQNGINCVKNEFKDENEKFELSEIKIGERRMGYMTVRMTFYPPGYDSDDEYKRLIEKKDKKKKKKKKTNGITKKKKVVHKKRKVVHIKK